jgi:hypothetical protein
VSPSSLPDAARVLLAGVRLVNGTASLVAPRMFARRIGVDPDTNGPALYALRLFGVRTILIGAQLLSRDPEVRADALRRAVAIHVSDAAAAAIAGATGQLPPKGARAALLTSSVNVALAVLAREALARR